MAATTTGVMDAGLCGTLTTVQADVAIGTTSGDMTGLVQAEPACLLFYSGTK